MPAPAVRVPANEHFRLAHFAWGIVHPEALIREVPLGAWTKRGKNANLGMLNCLSRAHRRSRLLHGRRWARHERCLMVAVTIRPATPVDATHLACFVDMASGGLALRVWETLRGQHQTLFEVGRSRALREDGAFSYRNGHIAEVGGTVAGALVGYPIVAEHDASHRAPDSGEAQKLPPFIRPLVELESLVPGHWYVNILATYPEYRGQGIGAALLGHAEVVGRAVSPSGMAVIVASQNESARRLYARSGYRETARRPQAAVSSGESDEWLLLTRPRL